MIELVNHDLKGAPYGFTPMCDSRTEMEGFRFWKVGYWKNFSINQNLTVCFVCRITDTIMIFSMRS